MKWPPWGRELDESTVKAAIATDAILAAVDKVDQAVAELRRLIEEDRARPDSA